MEKLLEASKNLRKAEDSYYYDAIKLIKRIVSTIAAHPNVEKFRKINQKGKVFKSIRDCKGAPEFLKAVGFVDSGNLLLLPMNVDLHFIQQTNSHLSSINDIRKKEKLEQRKQQNKQFEQKKREKQQIAEQFKLKRKDANDVQFAASKNVLCGKSGTSKITKFADVGVDLNKGGG